MTRQPVPVVLDVDTGVDDALALLLALRHRALDVRAVTCVAGNASLDRVLANTLRVLDAAGAAGVPVARGAAGPPSRPPRPARSAHGADGMGDLALPESTRRPVDVSAVELLRTTILGARAPVTLLALGPRTNVAALLRNHPELTHRMRIVLVGGAGDAAEEPADVNVWYDPEAAREVLLSGGPVVTVYGLDVFGAPTVAAADVDGLAAADDSAPRLAGRLLRHQAARFGGHRPVIGDAGAVAAVACPVGLRTVRRRLADPSTDVEVAVEVAAERYGRLLVDTLLARPSAEDVSGR